MKNLSATYKGLVIGILMLIIAVITFYILKLPVTGNNQFIPMIIFIAGICWSLLSLKMHTETVVSFKTYFSEGFKTFVVVALIMVTYTFVFYKLNPQILENALKENNVLALKQGNHTPAEIDANSDKLRSIFMPMMLTINTIKYLILGALVSLIGAGFLSQKK